ncbi:unnamed protein product, partial [Musa acuminata subsp. burmannicoides]
PSPRHLLLPTKQPQPQGAGGQHRHSTADGRWLAIFFSSVKQLLLDNTSQSCRWIEMTPAWDGVAFTIYRTLLMAIQ